MFFVTLSRNMLIPEIREVSNSLFFCFLETVSRNILAYGCVFVFVWDCLEEKGDSACLTALVLDVRLSSAACADTNMPLCTFVYACAWYTYNVHRHEVSGQTRLIPTYAGLRAGGGSIVPYIYIYIIL